MAATFRAAETTGYLHADHYKVNNTILLCFLSGEWMLPSVQQELQVTYMLIITKSITLYYYLFYQENGCYLPCSRNYRLKSSRTESVIN